MVMAATIPAPKMPSAKSAAPQCPINGCRAWANSAASKFAVDMWCINSGAVAGMVASAATVANAAPSTVSTRPKRTLCLRVVRPLSAIALC